MEDWSYGVGFDTTKGSQQPTCQPNSNLPFNPEDFLAPEKLNNVRAAVYLVESSNQKSPSKTAYGTDDNIFCNTCIGDGYIPRNIRLMKSFVDLVQPSVHFDVPKVVGGAVELKFKVNGCLNID